MASLEPQQVDRDTQFHTSVLLQKLIDEAPGDFFTLDWLASSMPSRSFGVIILFLALLTMIPIVSILARGVLLILALQIMLGYESPVLPRRFMSRPLSTQYLMRIRQHAIPTLKQIEKAVRPRWPYVLSLTRRPGSFMAFILILVSLAAPLPLANMPAAAIILLMALAYIEHDGVLLLVAHIAGVAVLSILALTIYEVIKI